MGYKLELTIPDDKLAETIDKLIEAGLYPKVSGRTLQMNGRPAKFGVIEREIGSMTLLKVENLAKAGPDKLLEAVLEHLAMVRGASQQEIVVAFAEKQVSAQRIKTLLRKAIDVGSIHVDKNGLFVVPEV